VSIEKLFPETGRSHSSGTSALDIAPSPGNLGCAHLIGVRRKVQT
jgi:hypothetical protein